nr:retrovirus-related Pol polyprotein from transposon TNT 1-94 [Tanacetum cinerariifolium]
QTIDIPLDLIGFFRKHPSIHQCQFLKTLVISYHIASRAANTSSTPWSVSALSWALVTEVVVVVVVTGDDLDDPFRPKTADDDAKPESQWTPNERRVVVQDQRLKSIIMASLPDDIMESVISCVSAKETWTDLVHSFEGPSDTKENRIMNLKLEYQTFRAKSTESLSQTYTRYKNLLNELANDGGLRNTNHTQTLELADIYGRFVYEDNLIQRRLRLSILKTFQPKKKGLVTETFDWDEEEVFDNKEVTQVKVLMALADDDLTVGKSHARNGEWVDITIRKMLIDEKVNSNQKTQESNSKIQKTESSKSVYSSRMSQDSKPKVQNTVLSKSLKQDHRTLDHEMYIASLKRSENYKAQPYKYASPSDQILKAKAKPFPPCTHYGFNNHKPDDCRNYPECEICMEAIRFTHTSEYEIGIDESSRYPLDEFVHEDDPSRQYRIDSDISYYVIPHGPLDLIHSKRTHEQNVQNDEMITQPMDVTSGNNTEVSGSVTESLVPNVTQSHIFNKASTSSHPIPQDRWLRDQHIELVNIIVARMEAIRIFLAFPTGGVIPAEDLNDKCKQDPPSHRKSSRLDWGSIQQGCISGNFGQFSLYSLRRGWASHRVISWRFRVIRHSSTQEIPEEIYVLSGNYSSTKQVNLVQQLLAYCLITGTQVDIGEIIYSLEAFRALYKKSKKPKSKKTPAETKETSTPKPTEGYKKSYSVSSGTGTRKLQSLPESTTIDPKDSVGNKQPIDTSLTSTAFDEGTDKTMSHPEGSLGDNNSGGNKPSTDMEPINPTVADPLGTGAKYQAVGIAKTHHQSPSPQADKPQSSHASSTEASDTNSSCDDILKKYDNTLPIIEYQLVNYLRKVSTVLFDRITEDNREKHEEAVVDYANLKASIDEYYDENIAHRDLTNKLVEASMSSLDKSNTTISDFYKGLNIITELLKEINNVVKDELVINKKINEATDSFTKISTNITEVLSLVKYFNFSDLQSFVNAHQAHALKQDEELATSAKSFTNMAWNLDSRLSGLERAKNHIQSSMSSLKKDTNSIKTMITEMYEVFKGQSLGSVAPTLAPTHIPTNFKGENGTSTATEDPPSHTEGQADANREEKSEEPKHSTDANIEFIGLEAFRALYKKSKKPKSKKTPAETKETSTPKPTEGYKKSYSVSSGTGTRKLQSLPESTTIDPKDSVGNKQPIDTSLTSTAFDEGTDKTMSHPEGSLGDNNSGGNKPSTDMEPINPTVADPLGTGAKYQAVGIAKTHHQSPSPQADKPQSSHASSTEASDTNSSCDDILKKYDNTLPIIEYQLVNYLRKVSTVLFDRITEDNREKHEEAVVDYANLKASIDEYYDENIAHRDLTNKLVEASMSSLDKSNTTISDFYKGLNIITELLKEINNVVKDELVINKKINEATDSFTKISTNITEVLSLVKYFNFSDLQSFVNAHQAHALKQDEELATSAKSFTNMAWNLDSRLSGLERAKNHIQSSMSSLKKDTNSIKTMITEMYEVFKGQSLGSVAPTLAPTHIPTNFKGENGTNTATEDPPSHTEGQADANREEKSKEPKHSTDANIEFIGSSKSQPSITQAQPITIINPEPIILHREGKGIATDEKVEDQRKLAKASSIIRPDPDAHKKEKIKKAKEEARLIAISKLEVIKIVSEEAKKLVIHPKEAITTKDGEKFKKAQDAEHEVLKRQHTEKFGISELDELREIIPRKKNVVVQDLMNSLSRRYERIRKNSKELGIKSAHPAPTPKQASSKSLRKKRKHIELEPEIKIPRLECNRALPENVPFVKNMVIEEPEHGIFFTDKFSNQEFQR